jgi:hypothetical protein
MQASGRGLAVLAGQAAEEAGARPRRGHVSTVMDIEVISLSRVRGCCPTRQAAAIWVMASMGETWELCGIPLPNLRQTPWAVCEHLLPIHG